MNLWSSWQIHPINVQHQLVVLDDLQRFDHRLVKLPQRNAIKKETRSTKKSATGKKFEGPHNVGTLRMALTTMKAYNQKMALNVLENMFINPHVSGAHPSWSPW